MLHAQSGKASMKRCVFTMFLNISTEFTSLMCCGSEFHKVGAPTLNDWSAKVLHLVLGTLSYKYESFDADEHRPGLVGLLYCRSSVRYDGPCLCRHLYVSTSSLNSILCQTGSQCSCFRHSDILSLFDFLSTKHAHMFCIHCSLAKVTFGML